MGGIDGNEGAKAGLGSWLGDSCQLTRTSKAVSLEIKHPGPDASFWTHPPGQLRAIGSCLQMEILANVVNLAVQLVVTIPLFLPRYGFQDFSKKTHLKKRINHLVTSKECFRSPSQTQLSKHTFKRRSCFTWLRKGQ